MFFLMSEFTQIIIYIHLFSGMSWWQSLRYLIQFESRCGPSLHVILVELHLTLDFIVSNLLIIFLMNRRLRKCQKTVKIKNTIS